MLNDDEEEHLGRDQQLGVLVVASESAVSLGYSIARVSVAGTLRIL
jgi:hypothetical protein